MRHRRVQVPGTANPPKYENVFYGDGWGVLVEAQQLNADKRIIFKNRGENSVTLLSFTPNGLGLGFENIPRTTLNHAAPIMRGPLDSGMHI